MKECRKKGKVQKKNYEFLLHGNILCAKYGPKWFNKLCIVLPSFVAELVVRHFHIEKKFHVSSKQIATLFGQSFYCFGLEEICKKITNQCLHCSTNFYRNRQTKALGKARMFNDILTPNVCWSFDTMFLPPSQGFTHILLGVESISSYIVLYPMKGPMLTKLSGVCTFTSLSFHTSWSHVRITARNSVVNLLNSCQLILSITYGRFPQDHK